MFYHDNLVIEIIDILHLHRGKSKYHTPNRPFHILSKRISGHSNLIFKNITFEATSKDLMYIPANCEYLRQSYGDEEIIAIHFNILNKNIFSPICVKVDTHECDEIFKEIFEIWDSKVTGYKYKCTSILYAFLSSIVIPKSTTENYFKIERSIQYMENNLDKKIYVKDLSKICGLCESQYRKLFKHELGVSPINYLNKLRINSALIKIGANNYTMAQISEMCGFTEQKYFNKIFRDVTGKSPSQYKKEIHNL